VVVKGYGDNICVFLRTTPCHFSIIQLGPRRIFSSWNHISSVRIDMDRLEMARR